MCDVFECIYHHLVMIFIYGFLLPSDAISLAFDGKGFLLKKFLRNYPHDGFVDYFHYVLGMMILSGSWERLCRKDKRSVLNVKNGVEMWQIMLNEIKKWKSRKIQ